MIGLGRRAVYFLIAAGTVAAPGVLATAPDPADHSMRKFLSQEDVLHPYRATRRLEAEDGDRKGAATTPLTIEKAMIVATLTTPTRPSASPFRSGDTSRETCHSSAAFCIVDPVSETNSPIHIRRTLRC